MLPLKIKLSNLKQHRRNIPWLFILLFFLSYNAVEAQFQNNGSIFINDGTTIYLQSGAFTFGSGSSTVTTRTPIIYGKLQLGPTATVNGAISGAALFMDGYAATKTNNYFVLPTGQASLYAPIGVTNPTVINGVAASFYSATPINVGATLATSVVALSSSGYWLVKGDDANLTLIWNNDISSITNTIANLTIAGFNTSTAKWEAIASNAPIGSLASGTITTAAIVPLANYSAFTFAKRGVSCAPVFAASGTTKTWNGSWSPSAPSEIDPAIISGAGAPGSFICNSLAVNANITLTDGQTIEVINEISGTNSITMSSQASILQRNDSSTITPTITLTKSTRTNMYPLDYIYWGSPLTTNSFNQLATAQAFNNANTTTSGSVNAFDLKYKYVSGDATAAGGWQSLTATAPGVGFIMRIKQQAPFATIQSQNTTDHINLTFSGTANNGNVNVNIANLVATPTSARNNNLLANPYPSAIDADKFLEYNTNLDGVVYIWKAQTSNSGAAGAVYNVGDYIAYTRAGSTAQSGIGATVFNGKIATGQGFKVKAITTSGTGTAFFNNCMRISGNNDQFMKTANDVLIDRYKLNLTGANGIGNQILIAYMPDRTLGYDRMYDAELNSVNAAQLYSTTSQDQTKKLAINARPIFENSDIVSLGLSKSNATTEEFSIAIAEKEGIFATNTVAVFLQDMLLNTYHNFANGPYTFNSSTMELSNRFQIVYQDATLNNFDFESNNVLAAINKETLKIVTSLPILNVSIYDISGRLITEINGNNQTTVSNAFFFAEGIYIAKIKMNNGAIATKKLINKN